MRLYLSSFGLGRHGARLAELVGDRRRAAVVGNAIDGYPDGRGPRLERESAALRELGLAPVELDLRQHFGTDPARLRAACAGCGLVWLRGGNVFTLRRAMLASGLDTLLLELLAADALVLGGYSAGASVATPSLRGLEVYDDPAEQLPGYPPEPVWDGLGLVPYRIVPHYRSDHPETAAADTVVELYRRTGVPFRALRDGEVIVVDGATEQTLG